MQENVCALCLTNEHAETLYPATITHDALTPAIFSARRSPDRLHGEMLRCRVCGLVYPRHRIDPGLLASLYAQSSCTYGDEEPFIRATYRPYLRRALETWGGNKEAARYLDIGCGRGFMLEEAKEMGIQDVWGIEPGEATADRAAAAIRPRIMRGLFSPALVGERRFDIITCFQTLDHIQDPVGFVRDCRSVLAPGGVVLFINHNIASWTARLLGERCPMIDIEHTFLHTPLSMKLLFERAGFQNLSIFRVTNRYELRYWLHLLPCPAIIRRMLLWSTTFTGISRCILPLSVGNMGLIARTAPAV